MALEKLMGLFQATEDHARLKGAIAGVRPRAAASYRFLLRALSEAKSGLRVRWGSPGRKAGQADLNLENVRAALTVLDEQVRSRKEEYRVHGRLVGVFTDKTRFEFVTDEDERYEGVYGPEVQRETLSIPLDKGTGGVAGTAILEEEMEVLSTGEERYRYTLLKILPDRPPT